jgi:hypothetical protein
VLRTTIVGAALMLGCTARHAAPVTSPPLPPLAGEVQHSGRLWVELVGYTEDRQCARPKGQSSVCFMGVHDAVTSALAQTAWTSFPAVATKQKGDDLAPGDYLLLVSIELDAVPPDARGPGWSTAARAKWKLVRDGIPVASGAVASRSRADFAYGRVLGIAAGEVIGAVSAHIAGRVGELPEERPQPVVPLPPVLVGETPKPRMATVSAR